MLAPATLAALPSTRAIPDRDVFYVAHPIRSVVEDLQAALVQLTRSLPLSRPHGFAHLCRGLIRLRPQARPFGSPHLCRTASRWLHSQLAPFAEIAADLKR